MQKNLSTRSFDELVRLANTYVTCARNQINGAARILDEAKEKLANTKHL